MRIIAITNQKGGCAKTTTVVNLAASLMELGKKVLVIDLDPQANSSQWLGGSTADACSFRLLTDDTAIAELIAPSSIEGVDLISASKELLVIEKVLAGELAVEGRLKRKLKNLSKDAYDFILIDTPPMLGLLTMNACVAANELLVPVTTHVMTLSGVSQLIAKFNEITEVINPNLRILGFLPSRVDARTRHSRDVLQSLKDRFGEQVLKVNIRECIFLAEAPSFKESILSYKSKSSAAADFRELAKEVLSRNQ
jgi:chromosome partitioning protein